MGCRVQWNISRQGAAHSKCGRFRIVPVRVKGKTASYILQRIYDSGEVIDVSRHNETRPEAKEDAEWQAAFEAGELEFSRASSDVG